MGSGAGFSRCRAAALLVPAVVEVLVMDVRHEAKAKRGVGVIEDQAVRLALGRAKTTADDLGVEDFRFGRPGQDDAAHVPVHARRQRVDVADHLDLTLAAAALPIR